jgi:Kef-type K+ transport system membrane component KefB
VTTVSFASLVLVAAIAVVAPLLAASLPRIRIPAVVLEIVGGIIVGPHGLKLVKTANVPVQILASVGLAFLLFLAGLEIDVELLRGPLLRLVALGYAITLAFAFGAGEIFKSVGIVHSPMFVAITLAATALGLVVPVLKDAKQTSTELGQLTIAASSVADFGAVVLLTLFFSGTHSSGSGAKIVLLGGFGLLAATVGLALSRLNRSMRVDSILVKLGDATSEIRVRVAVLLLVGFVALAERFGLETILGAFIAGGMVGLIDRDSATHPHFRLKLEAIGYGFVVPVFFVASGLTFDLGALLHSPAALDRVPLFFFSLVIVRGLPAALYRRSVGTRGAVAAGLLQATSLPLIVTATAIGEGLHLISPVTGAALVAAGLLSVVFFPPIALGLLRRENKAVGDVGPTSVAASRLM